MLSAILAIAGLIIIVAAVAYLCWSYIDYIINAWNWVVEAYNALIATDPVGRLLSLARLCSLLFSVSLFAFYRG